MGGAAPYAPPPDQGFQSPQGYQPQPGYAPPSAPSSPIRDALTARGYDVSGFPDDESMINAFGETLPMVEQMPMIMQNAREGMRYREHQTEFEEYMAQRGQQVPPAAPQKKSWEAPPLDPAWASHVRFDQESGRYVGRDMLSSPVAVEGMNRRADWQRENNQKFWDNPYDFVYQGLEEKLSAREEELLKKWEQRQEQQRVRGETEAWLRQNMGNFYALDQGGNPLVDPRTGLAVMTPTGQAFQGYAQQARQIGISHPLHVRDYALAMTQRDLALSAQQPAPAGGSPAMTAPAGAPPRGPDGKFIPAGAAAPPQQPVAPLTAGQRSQAHLDNFLARATGAAHVANRGGSEFAAAAAGAPPQNPNMSFGEMAIAELRNRGAVPQTG
jgi:hypothetical protein